MCSTSPSIHGDTTNFYPVVTGYENEWGSGAGYGYNINLFFDRLDEAMAALRLFKPEVVIAQTRVCLG